MARRHLVVGHEVSSVDDLVERSHSSQETTSQKNFTGHFTGTPVNPLWWVRVEFTLNIYSLLCHHKNQEILPCRGS